MLTYEQILIIALAYYFFMFGYILCFIIENWKQIKPVRKEYKENSEEMNQKYGSK